MKKKLIVLGCTGSIGQSTLKIIQEFPDLFEVVGLSANSKPSELIEIGKKYNCTNLFLSSKLQINFSEIKYYGLENLNSFIETSQATLAVNGVAGAAGLVFSTAILQHGIDLALANKETIVMASSLIYDLAQKNNCKILPVDSEHSAIFNLIEKYGKNSVDSIILTASGGPFRTFTRKQLEKVTVDDALKHPTWNMGAKITIDSATLANKGLEVIEACRLFSMPTDKVQVTVHPQSLVHSLIQTKDGVLYAQMSPPDMRHPILSALTWPEFLPNSLEKLDLTKALITSPLECSFAGPNKELFPMLSLAYEAASNDGAYTIAYNAANEIAVELFSKKIIGFYDISDITEKVLQHDWTKAPVTFDDVFLFDSMARSIASGGIK